MGPLAGSCKSKLLALQGQGEKPLVRLEKTHDRHPRVRQSLFPAVAVCFVCFCWCVARQLSARLSHRMGPPRLTSTVPNGLGNNMTITKTRPVFGTCTACSPSMVPCNPMRWRLSSPVIASNRHGTYRASRRVPRPGISTIQPLPAQPCLRRFFLTRQLYSKAARALSH
ncbi:hypothetical protein MAPG_08662 [Magnaporthiopsis poae ATCC 64411]|uniref:Uncharacterized protein n=1 Tax=Magnaporthiopsis poae (strain ATCC 64411 / 73-15) TaxID=644358 RepID=A0A0C4E7Y0_MAGP6|nr:hypothetical protein MAPG_08662 [Magnaporthiopsis poae ATCC 64411]